MKDSLTVGSVADADDVTNGADEPTKPLDGEYIPSANRSRIIDGVSMGRLGRYELIREIGRGGFGIVYLAEDTQLTRQVAVKIARPELVSDEAGIQRFRQEARAAATLDHPGIIPVFDCGEENGLHFYVMPFLDCENLAQWLAKQKEPLSERVAAQLIKDIADAIHFGHQRGIIHRDLKPQNILLKPDPLNPNGFRPVVLDFGLCGLVETGDTSTSMLAGTPRYMSPEQAMFGFRKITPRSDVYSLGVILYQVLTGQPPHQPTSISEAILMLHGASIESPKTLRSDLSSSIEAICLQCLRKDHDRRYSTAEMLAQDLGRFLDGTSVSARPAGLWERIDFAIRFGDWEARLGWGVIAINATSIIWAEVGAVMIRMRFPGDANVSAGINELLLFLGFIALPTHLLGIYMGWLLTKRTMYFKRLIFGVIVGGFWTIDLWKNFFSDEIFLRIYQGQAYTQTMVFLLLGVGFLTQTIFLALGAWAAYCRKLVGQSVTES